MPSKSTLTQMCQRSLTAMLMMAAVYFLSHTIAWANGGDAWRLLEVSGTVRVQQGEAPWQAAQSGMTIREGDGLETGADGRALLKSGGDTVTVSPDSRFVVPAQSAGGLGANIIQKLGTLLFKIERTPDRRFAVDTPHLAAVVKGTVFSVTVRPDGGALQVTEGAVQVASLASGEVALVRPGQIAQIPSGPVGRMIILDRGQTFRAPPADGKATRMAEAAGPADKKSARAPETSAPAKDAKAPQGRVVALAINKMIGAQKLDIAKATNGLVAPAAAQTSSPGKGRERGRIASNETAKPADGSASDDGQAKQDEGTKGSLVSAAATTIGNVATDAAGSDGSKKADTPIGGAVGTAVGTVVGTVVYRDRCRVCGGRCIHDAKHDQYDHNVRRARDLDRHDRGRAGDIDGLDGHCARHVHGHDRRRARGHDDRNGGERRHCADPWRLEREWQRVWSV
jgi:hypothetical protein